jgi:YggT family protein
MYTSALGQPRNRAMVELFTFISFLLTLYIYVLVAAAVMSWLVAFNVVNPRNQFVSMVGEFLYRITEPVLRPIRNRLPNLGGIDISPIIVIVIIWFIQIVVLPVLLRMLI